MATVATNIQTNHESLAAAIPFVLATASIVALPVLGYLLFHKRAVVVMPKLRDWMKRQQLAGEHHRVRDLHRADPLATRPFQSEDRGAVADCCLQAEAKARRSGGPGRSSEPDH